MQSRLHQLAAALFLSCVTNTSGTVLYVDLNSPTPTPPYTNWITAATNIQDAVDAANLGDQVLVTNGVYQTGGRIVYGAITNRVAVTKALTVQSLNGAAVTAIQGNAVVGDTAVRCVYLTNNTLLIGFTLANGATRKAGDNTLEQSGGGVWCESTNAIIRDCLIVSNLAQFYGGGACRGTLTNCTLTYSGVTSGGYGMGGGGAYGSLLINCTVSSNRAPEGGGVFGGILNNCTIAANVAGTGAYGGGGTYNSTLFNCLVASNTTYAGGGGVYGGTLSNCTIFKNYAYDGGGAYLSAMNNCLVISNRVSNWGAGTYNCTLTYCTLAGNIAGAHNGAAAYSTLNNCLMVFNQGPGAYTSKLYNCLVTSNASGGVYICTLSNCAVAYNGGTGAEHSTLDACVLLGNAALSGGGGASYSTLNDCLVVSNSLSLGTPGGGAGWSYLNNCTVVGNSASSGGGLSYCTNRNSIVYFNNISNSNSSSNYNGCAFTNCCTMPLPDSGVGNFTNAPLFVNLAGGNLRLQSGSPCINAGNNLFVTNSADLDRGPRIVDGTVDIGTYEFGGSVLPYFWLQQYGLPTDGSADFIDTDHDGLNNWQEWIAGTNPTNALSALKMLVPGQTNNPPSRTLTWQSVQGVNYFLQRSTNLLLQPAFSTLQSNIAGQTNTTSFTDTTATNSRPYFYRVGVQ